MSPTSTSSVDKDLAATVQQLLTTSPKCTATTSVLMSGTRSTAALLSRPLTMESISDADVKREEVHQHLTQSPKILRFTPQEDQFLRNGTAKYGLSQWSKILKDKDYQFHPCRSRDSLRIRAETIGITKRKKSSGRKIKERNDIKQSLNLST